VGRRSLEEELTVTAAQLDLDRAIGGDRNVLGPHPDVVERQWIDVLP